MGATMAGNGGKRRDEKEKDGILGGREQKETRAGEGEQRRERKQEEQGVRGLERVWRAAAEIEKKGYPAILAEIH